MGIYQPIAATRSAQSRGWNSPFTCPVPDAISDALLHLQLERLCASLPLLCLTVTAGAIAMGAAIYSDLPLWQQLGPPAIIVGTCLFLLGRSLFLKRTGHRTFNPQILRAAPFVAGALGGVAGLWCVNAFIDTEQYYCMVAPVFIGILALVAATCLLSVPRAAVAAIIATLLPIVLKLASYDNLGLRAMAGMLVIIGGMQAFVVLSKFRETVATLVLQDELSRLAGTDALTGIDNRLSFMQKFEDCLARDEPILLVLGDLDGFKQINDQHGHAAGDMVLSTVAQRLQSMANRAASVARLGGDEFALLYTGQACDLQVEEELRAAITMVSMPVQYGRISLSVGLSHGKAKSPEDGKASSALFALADLRLYIDKAHRKGSAHQDLAA